MTETKTLNGLVKVKRNYGPSVLDAMFTWLLYGMFRMVSYRLFFPFGMSFFGLALNIILLFSAISVTFRALFTPRYSYTFQTEVENEESSTPHESPHESPESKVKSEPMPNEVKSEPKPEPIISKKSESDESKDSNQNEAKLHFCSYCGCEVPEIARFCSECGERLR